MDMNLHSVERLGSYGLIAWGAWCVVTFLGARHAGLRGTLGAYFVVGIMAACLDVWWLQIVTVQSAWNGTPDHDLAFVAGFLVRVVLVGVALFPAAFAGNYFGKRARQSPEKEDVESELRSKPHALSPSMKYPLLFVPACGLMLTALGTDFVSKGHYARCFRSFDIAHDLEVIEVTKRTGALLWREPGVGKDALIEAQQFHLWGFMIATLAIALWLAAVARHERGWQPVPAMLVTLYVFMQCI